MINADTINNFVTILGIYLCSFIIFSKSINYKKYSFLTIICTVVFCSGLSLLNIILYLYFSQTFRIFFLSFLSIVYITRITNIDIHQVISCFFISLGISFVTYIASSLLTGLLNISIYRSNDYNLLFVLLTMVLQFLISYRIFSIKRFRNGFSFLMKRSTIILSSIFIGVILFCILLMISYTEITSIENAFLFYLLIAISIVYSVSIIIWIRKGITTFYKEKLKDQTIEMLENTLIEKDKEIDELRKENTVITNASHAIIQRLSVLEFHTKTRTSQSSNLNSNQYGDIVEQLNTMMIEYRDDIKSNSQVVEVLPSTKVTSIDTLFEYMAGEAAKKDIKFNLVINGSVNYLIEHIIPKSKLETMLGDHIRDAIIAIDSSSSIHRNILVILGVIDSCYELSFDDSGIEFEIETLVGLGTKAITTHKDTGGSGIGFMTTFETMRETGASLIIIEKVPSDSDFTKSVIIRFDGKNQYIIKSYRADTIGTINTTGIRIEDLRSYIK